MSFFFSRDNVGLPGIALYYKVRLLFTTCAPVSATPVRRSSARYSITYSIYNMSLESDFVSYGQKTNWVTEYLSVPHVLLS